MNNTSLIDLVNNYQYDIGYVKKNNSFNLFAWHEVDNYGDKLGPALFHLLSKKPTYIESRGLRLIFEYGTPRTIYCFLGTLAQLVYGPHKFVFWGFGTTPAKGPKHHGAKPIEKNLNIEFKALRGPLTHKYLINSGYSIPTGIPYGDPGLVTPYFFKRSSEVIDDFCIVPHHTQFEEWSNLYKGLKVIDIGITKYEDIQNLILEITKYKVIFSSSLHVTILAESFGIPTKPIEPKLTFKFDDFYASCNKKMVYIKKASPQLDWNKLYKDCLENWEPINWNPIPFLKAAPFSINGDVKEKLSMHYKKLLKAKRFNMSGGYYLNNSELKKSSVKTNKESRQKSKSLFLETFKHGLSKWLVQNKAEKAAIDKVKHKIQITMPENNCYLASPFFSLAKDVNEVEINIEFLTKNVFMEVRLQDEKFQTWESITVKEDDNSIRILFWPVQTNLKMRLVFIPFKGQVLIKKVKAIGKWQ